MTVASPLRAVPGGEIAFIRAIQRRAKAGPARKIYTAAVAGLAWLATFDPLVLAWVAVTLAAGVLEDALGRRALENPGRPGLRRWTAAGQALVSTSYASIALVVLRNDRFSLLPALVFVLCTTALNNARQASGSRLGTAATLAPPALVIVACSLWAGLGSAMPLSNAGFLLLSGIFYIGFTVHLARTLHAEAETVRKAGREAAMGNHRWRMLFDRDPIPRVCFDASVLYEILRVRADRDGLRLGDAARTEFATMRELTQLIDLIEVNGAAAALYGEKFASAFTADYMEAFCEALNGMEEDGSIPPFEAELSFPGARRMMAQVHCRMTSGEGAPWSLCLATYADVTEAHRIAQDQKAAREAAEEASRVKTDFLAAISHEIRTPLNGVLGMAQAMDREPMPARQRERLRVIRESGGALMQLMDDLIDLSQIETGRLVLEPQDFDLRVLVEAARTDFATEAASKGLALTADIDPGIHGMWRGDPARLRQVLSNLISNGVKFTPHGRVTVRLAASASGVRLEVSDTGIGIAPDRVARLFEKFVQEDASPTRAYSGTGLGLAICQELCRAMGGVISVASRPGAGSTFAVELPLRQARRPAAAPACAPVAATSEAPLRILAADDNAVNRMVLKALMAQFGVELTLVEDGAEAVRAWEGAHWDLILMDVAMPVMDGATATMTIRAREGLSGRARTPIIAVTANTLPHQVASYRAAGMDDVVSKPLSVANLYAAIAAAISAETEPALRSAS